MNMIGENISRFRKQKGLTQEALASAIGVSAQSVSKWENNTTMPDILLLPIIADLFGSSIDTLFGRIDTQKRGSAEQAYDLCCDALLQTMLTCMHAPYDDEPFEQALSKYQKHLTTDPQIRTAIIKKHGVIYYRHEIGGLLLKKPCKHWHELLDDRSAAETLQLLADSDFRTALCEIIKGQKTTFTMASLCSSCAIKNSAALQESFAKSKLFVTKEVDIDGSKITIYDLVQGQRLFLLFAVLTYAKEQSTYEDIYTGYYGSGDYYLA